MDFLVPKVGRPPKRVPPDEKTTLTIGLWGREKNLMIDQAEAYDMTLTEYLVMLTKRDVAAKGR